MHALLALHLLLLLQGPSATNKPVRKPVPPPSVADTTFDTSVAALPLRFAGNDFVRLYRRFALPSRGEFETTDSYHRRISAVPQGTYAFRLAEVWITYDADTRLMRVDTSAMPMADGSSAGAELRMLVVRSTKRHTGTYVGSNAFGVTRRVSRVTQDRWGLLVDSPFFSRTFAFEVAPQDASQLKALLSVLVVVELEAFSVPRSYVTLDLQPPPTGFESTQPTLDDPEYTVTYYYALRGRVTGYIVYQFATGQVLARFDNAGTFVRSFVPHDTTPSQ